MSVHIANPRHEVLYQELIALCGRYTRDLPETEILAVAANMVGKIVAMQDQRTMTPEKAMAIVAANMEHGNRQVLEELARAGGSA